MWLVGERTMVIRGSFRPTNHVTPNQVDLDFQWPSILMYAFGACGASGRLDYVGTREQRQPAN